MRKNELNFLALKTLTHFQNFNLYERTGEMNHMKTLIYLEDAIDAIKNADVLVSYDTGTDTDDACELAIRATKGTIIEELNVLPPANPGKVCIANINMPEEKIREVTEMVKNGIAHSPIHTEPGQRWTPVTERCPEPNTRCLVTTEDGYIDIDDYYIYGWDDNCDTVIAWLPMPEPYKEDK